MLQLFVHPQNPQPRLLAQAAEILKQGGVIVYPTDCGYALGCLPGLKSSMDRIRRLRQLDHKHLFSLICANIAEAANYARIDNHAFKLIKHHTPGPYTFILPATKEVPKQLLNPKRRTIGLHIPDNLVLLQLLAQLDSPLVSVSLIDHTDEHLGYACELGELVQPLAHDLDCVIDIGDRPMHLSSIIDFTQSSHQILRQGLGNLQDF